MRSAPPGIGVLAALLVTLAFARPLRAQGGDSIQVAMPAPEVRAWQTGVLRPDRLQHASLSFALGVGAGLASDSPATGAGVALGLGVAKEIADRHGSGFDAIDLLADAIGAGLAAWAVSSLER